MDIKVLILRSVEKSVSKDPYSVEMDTRYADRLLGHLTNRSGICGGCGDNCIKCRSRYDLDLSASIAGVYEFPSVTPAIVDSPEDYLPEEVPTHHILIPVAVNEEIIVSFIEKFPVCRGVIVPLEGSSWISTYAINKITEICKEYDIEADFPKPFCAFNPSSGVLAEFKNQFKIGKPELVYDVKEGVILKARVVYSAPCGATYFTARGLEGKKLDQDLQFIIDSRLSAYPCTADRSRDPDFNDSITHQAVKKQRDILKPLFRYSIV
ncbi:MAG: DUF166 family protein [Spirochaetota bacterium]